jgi:adhesin/invasin
MFKKQAILLMVIGISSLTFAGGGELALKESAKSKIQSAVSEKITDTAKSYLPNIEISGINFDASASQFEMFLVQPLMDDEVNGKAVFFQGSLISKDHRNTANLGVGARKIADDGKRIFGINAFYDQEFKYDHKRVSLGGEYLTSVGDLRANKYWAISNSLTTRYGIETALDGYDLELSLPLPYMPTTKYAAKLFNWSGTGTNPDIEGEVHSIIIKIPFGADNLTLEAGKKSFDSSSMLDEEFVRLSYLINLGSVKPKQMSLFSDQAFNFTEITDRRFEKVRRTNTIVKETAANNQVIVSGY